MRAQTTSLAMDDKPSQENAATETDKYQNAHYRLYFSQFSQAIPAVLILLGLNVYNLHSSVPPFILYAWASALIFMYFIRSRIKFAYDKAMAAGVVADTDWGRAVRLGSLVTGIIWGSGAFLTLYGVEIEALMFMIVVITIMVTGNAVTHSSIKSAAFAFSTPAVLPFVLVLIVRGDWLDIQIAIAMLLLYITMLKQGGFLSAIVSKNIALSDDYLQSIQELEESSRQSVQLISELEKEIGERRHAEELLKISDNRYQIAEQLAGFGHWQWDIDANKTFFSKEASQLLYGNYEEKQLIGDIYSHLGKLVHPDDYDKLYNAIDYAIKNEITLEQKFRRISQGKEVWMQIKADILQNDQGKKTLYGVLRDISSEILFSMRLEQNVASVHALAIENNILLQKFHRPVIKLNAEGRIDQINKAMYEYWGMDKNDALMLTGTGIHTLIDSDSQQLINEVVRTCHDSEAVFEFEHKNIQREHRSLDVMVLPLCKDNVYVGLLLIAKD